MLETVVDICSIDAVPVVVDLRDGHVAPRVAREMDGIRGVAGRSGRLRVGRWVGKWSKGLLKTNSKMYMQWGK